MSRCRRVAVLTADMLRSAERVRVMVGRGEGIIVRRSQRTKEGEAIDILQKPTVEKVMVPKFRYACPANSELVRRKEGGTSVNNGPSTYYIWFYGEPKNDYDVQQPDLLCLK
jgi:hypothetical protein